MYVVHREDHLALRAIQPAGALIGIACEGASSLLLHASPGSGVVVTHFDVGRRGGGGPDVRAQLISMSGARCRSGGETDVSGRLGKWARLFDRGCE